MARIGEAFDRQTGVIEERTGTMQRALSVGVDSVRMALESSAVAVATSLRDKVMEITAALQKEAGNAFTDADRLIAERAEQTSAALLARANDIADVFADADQRILARAGETADTLSARAAEIAQVFERSDRTIVQRAVATAEMLAARASEIGQSFDKVDGTLSQRITEFGRSA